MTKELQTIQRQVIEKSIGLPRNTAFAGIQQGFDKLATVGTFAAEQIAVKQAGIEGAELAREKPGEVRKLAPGLTNATKAFNNSFNDVQTSLAVMGGADLMSKKLIDVSSPGRLNPKSIKDYNVIADGIIEGVLAGTNPENRADVALKLYAHKISNLEKLSNAVLALDKKNITEGLNLAFSDSLNNLRATIVSGSKQDQQLALAEADKNIKNYSNLQNITNAEKTKLERAKQQTIINATLEKEYTDAIVSSGESGGVRYITDFIASEQKEMTFVQKEQAKDFLLTLNTKLNKELNVSSTQAFSEIKSEYLDDPSSIPDLQTLDKKILEKSESGLPMNMAQQNQLKTMVQSANVAAAKRSATNASIIKAIEGKSTDIVDFSDKEMNDFFSDAVSAQKATRDNAIAAGDIPADRAPPDWQVEANVAALSPVPIKAMTERLNAKLTNRNLNSLEEGIRQYSFLTDANEEALSGLPDKVTAFADTMLLDIRNSPPDRDLSRIFDENKAAILDADDAVVATRVDNHKQEVKNNPKQNDRNIRKAFNISGGIFSNGDIPDDMRVTYNRLLSRNAKLYETKNYQLAVDKTIKQLGQIYKESPDFAPVGRPVPNPVEKLPFYNIGNGVPNQGANIINQAIQASEDFPDDMPVKFSRSDKMPEMPETLSDEQKFDENFAPNGYWINYEGAGGKKIETRVYSISPNFNKTDPFNPNVYQQFYGWKGEDGKDKEELRPMKTVQVQPDGSAQLGITMSTYFPPNIYMPAMMAKIDNERAEAGLESSALERIYKQNPIKLKDFSFPVPVGSGQKGIAELKEKLESRRIDVEKSKEIIKEEIRKSIENQKATRLGKSLEDEEDGQ
jgi:hypothetical protein